MGAKVVAAYGLPHTPFYPSQVIEEGPSSPTGQMFARARESLVAAKPDVILIFDTDHYNTFFFDNFPILAIGIDEKFKGPIDEPRGGMPAYVVPSMPELAEHLHRHTVRAGYDRRKKARMAKPIWFRCAVAKRICPFSTPQCCLRPR